MDWGRVGEIVIGSIPAAFGVMVFLLRMDRRLQTFLIEHEMLIGDYAKRNGVKVEHLPTRSRQYH